MEDFDNSPLVRTDFGNDAAGVSLVDAASNVSSDGSQALLRIVDDSSCDGTQPEQFVGQDWQDASVLFVADLEALSHPEQPILCVDLIDNPGRSFRCIPAELWGVENNLRLANMGFEDFAEETDPDGIFRGFR